jgi:hypothetical protein
MTVPLFIGFLLSFFFFLGLWLAISRSPLIPDLMEWFVTKEPMTHKDVDNWLIDSGRMNLFRLWTCPHCQSFWASVAHGGACSGILSVEFSNPLYILASPILILAFYPLYFFTITTLWKR